MLMKKWQLPILKMLKLLKTLRLLKTLNSEVDVLVVSAAYVGVKYVAIGNVHKKLVDAVEYADASR